MKTESPPPFCMMIEKQNAVHVPPVNLWSDPPFPDGVKQRPHLHPVSPCVSFTKPIFVPTGIDSDFLMGRELVT